MDNSEINSRADDKKSNKIIFRPAKRQIKDYLRTTRGFVGNRLCDECKKSALPRVCHVPESIL